MSEQHLQLSQEQDSAKLFSDMETYIRKNPDALLSIEEITAIDENFTLMNVEEYAEKIGSNSDNPMIGLFRKGNDFNLEDYALIDYDSIKDTTEKCDEEIYDISGDDILEALDSELDENTIANLLREYHLQVAVNEDGVGIPVPILCDNEDNLFSIYDAGFLAELEEKIPNFVKVTGYGNLIDNNYYEAPTSDEREFWVEIPIDTRLFMEQQFTDNLDEIDTLHQTNIIQTCENAMTEAGIDKNTIEAVLHTDVLSSQPAETILKAMLEKTVKQLNLHSSETQGTQFSYDLADNHAKLLMQTKNDAPVAYHEGDIHQLKEAKKSAVKEERV